MLMIELKALFQLGFHKNNTKANESVSQSKNKITNISKQLPLGHFVS